MKIFSTIPILLLITIVSCSSSKPYKADKGHQAQHEGIILQGKNHHLEIVGTHHDVKIFPLHEAAAGSTQLNPIPLDKVKLTVTYSPIKSEANYSVYLIAKEDHFWGEIDEKGENGYQLYITMKIAGKTENYIYVVRPTK